MTGAPAGPGALVISLDFELHWGVRDRRTLDDYGANLRGSREVVPKMLELFARHAIHATWATVGILFCEGREELEELLPEIRPSYAQRRLDPYAELSQLGRDEKSDPLHFAPSLVRRIADTDGQEVGTHTFSHYYCLEPGQTVEAFQADLRSATEAARRRGVTLRSIVFPRNEVNASYLAACREQGLVAYRGTQRSWMHRPRARSTETAVRRAARWIDAYAPLADHMVDSPARGPDGLVDVPASRFLRPRSRSAAALEPAKMRRVLGELETAARTGRVYHLWWHPHNFGVHQDEHLAQLETVVNRFGELRDELGMRSGTMAEVAGEARA